MKIEPLNYYLDGILSGNRRVLAKAITLVESSLVDHRRLAQNLVDEVLDRTGKAIRLGITGVPGVGKSTFIESFGMMLIERGIRVAVLAIDPSSSRSGGSILADKTRMERLSAAEGAFIRPSPSGGTLGGVARMTRETMLLCEAADFDVIIVETVGVGQSEVAVAGMVDFFLVLMITGAGDALQGIKKGILELADAVAINKADGDNVEPARKTRKELASAMHLMQPSSAVWTPPVLTCSSVTLEGLLDVWQTVQDHHRRLSASGELAEKRKGQALQWMWSMIHEGLSDRFYQHPEIQRNLETIADSVRNGMMMPTTAAQRLLFLLDNEGLYHRT
ncbi:MAG: methylmalonyl Co-A mutase-associated GTPase MeaB [Desulfobacteraceae bacterium]